MRKLITLVLLLSISFSYAQSPWTRAKGKTFLQVGATGLFYDSYEFDGKKVENAGDFTDITTQIYGEYGITNQLEALVIVPFKMVSVENALVPSSSLTGFGNVSLGLKYKLSDQRWKVSSGIIYTANTIKKDAASGLSTGFNATTFLPYLAVGSSHDKWYYYGNVGYGLMTNDYSDYLKLTFEVGYEVIEQGHLIFVLDTRNVVSKEDAYYTDAAQWPSYLDRQTFNALGIKANYEFKKEAYGVNLAAFGATGIDNAPLAPTFNIGIYTKF
ncbi:hypothetical protein [Flavobacterium sp. SM2513]|uniref:hypothetical protein n=1 Tax=Flavobacterium sp. SM2513 TaxID=3424766 RepID=UPI003D80008A